MFDEDNDQNGNQSDELAGKIANMLRAPRTSGQNDDDRDYVNPNIALRVDPASGIAYRVRPGLGGSNSSGRDGQSGQSGQAAANGGPSGSSSVYLPPIQTRDAQGKTLPKYRMGIGHRILATVANFANGFAGNRAAPIYVGPGALNNRYYQDEAYREQVNNENAGLGRNVIDWRTIAQDPTSKKWYGQTFGGEKQELGTPPWAAGQTDPADDAPNDDDEGEPPPIGAQVGPEPVKRPSARQRFGEIRRSKNPNSYR